MKPTSNRMESPVLNLQQEAKKQQQHLWALAKSTSVAHVVQVIPFGFVWFWNWQIITMAFKMQTNYHSLTHIRETYFSTNILIIHSVTHIHTCSNTFTQWRFWYFVYRTHRLQLSYLLFDAKNIRIFKMSGTKTLPKNTKFV